MNRFYDKVNKTNSCWLWTGSLTKYGYGKININKKYISTHRLSWELVNGKIPEGMHICHTCDVRSCVNPEHLFLGTPKDNAVDREQKGRSNSQGYKTNARRITECRYGHKDIYVDSKNARRCRTCRNQQSQKRYYINKQEDC